MSLYVLANESETHWWLTKGGFGPVNNGHLPMIFHDRDQAARKAVRIAELTGCSTHPLRLSALGEIKRRKR